MVVPIGWVAERATNPAADRPAVPDVDRLVMAPFYLLGMAMNMTAFAFCRL